MSEERITCEACGLSNPPGAITCVRCGAGLPRTAQPEIPRKQAQRPRVEVDTLDQEMLVHIQNALVEQIDILRTINRAVQIIALLVLLWALASCALVFLGPLFL